MNNQCRKKDQIPNFIPILKKNNISVFGIFSIDSMTHHSSPTSNTQAGFSHHIEFIDNYLELLAQYESKIPDIIRFVNYFDSSKKEGYFEGQNDEDFIFNKILDWDNSCSLKMFEKIGEKELRTMLYGCFEHCIHRMKQVNFHKKIIKAAQNGQIMTIIYLLQHGVDINREVSPGTAPLLKAASEGYFCIVELLISHGAEINSKDMAIFIVYMEKLPFIWLH